MTESEDHSISSCRRCGTCCRKGGPALHLEDKNLLDRGAIPLTALYALRKGELARDDIKGGLIRLSAEIIKIKSLPGSDQCMYLTDEKMACGIYDDRPVECRVLKCWDTRAIQKMYGHNRLTRQELFAKTPWLADLILAHEDECALEQVEKLVGDRIADAPAAAARLNEIINYDYHLRQVAAEKGGLPPDIMDVLFGRPLAEILPRQFRVKVKKR